MSERIVSIGEEDVVVQVEKVEQRRIASREGAAPVELLSITASDATVLIDGARVVIPFLWRGDQVEFQYRGEVYRAALTEPGARKKKRGGEHSMSAPMPGVVLKLLTTVGATVTKGTPLIVLEAMKMEHQINAPSDGVIKAIHCREGELVQPGVDLVEMQ